MPMEKVSVYVLNAPKQLDRPLDYYVPQELSGSIVKGNLVTVPLGGGNRHMAALVVEVNACNEKDRLKPIISCSSLSLSEEELGLVFFLKDRTFCTVSDAVHTIFPASVLSKITEVYQVTGTQIDASSVNQKSYLVWQYIRDTANVTAGMLKRHFGSEVQDALDALERSGYIRTEATIGASGNIKHTEWYSLTFDPPKLEEMCKKAGIRSKNQREILNYIAEHGSVSAEELRTELSVSAYSLKALTDRKMLVRSQEVKYRIPYQGTVSRTPPPLNECQQKALGEIRKYLSSEQPEAVLLHGITGSGKTRVIKETIDAVIAEGRQIILLVPEIALTPQTVGIFCSYYRDRVAVLHSGLSAGEKYDAWRRIRNGEVDLCIGTRSAIFAPFSRLGMIIVDEEHEHTYKSDQSPRYHAIDIARYRVSYHKALLLLASATPSLESYYKAQNGLYHLVEMKERATGQPLPETIIADLRSDAAAGNTSPLGLILQDSLRKNLSASQQSIFFINRRGFNNFLNCPMCGYVITCPHCSVSLTHHRSKQGKSMLLCHYCGYAQDIPTACPECGSDAFAFVGFGTQCAEEALNREFPEATVMRMDADTTGQKFSYDKMLDDFRQEKADILLGTQMVTKGHDFPGVTLVGVLLADTTLYLDDYRANERTFQLVTQVIGRAGRSDKHGRAVIQTYNPDHPALLLAASQDYEAFYREEIAMRRALVFPPFCDMALLSVSSADEIFLQRSVVNLAAWLKKDMEGSFSDVKVIVFGPFEAPVYKVKETYRMRFVIKCKSNKRTREMLKDVLNHAITQFGKKVTVSLDMNPNSL